MDQYIYNESNGLWYERAAVSKTSFFEFVIDGNTKGTFTMG